MENAGELHDRRVREFNERLARAAREEAIRRKAEWLRAHRELQRIEPAGGLASLSVRKTRRLLRRYNRYIAESPEFRALPKDEQRAVIDKRDTVDWLLRTIG